jgi:hypothetical protein
VRGNVRIDRWRENVGALIDNYLEKTLTDPVAGFTLLVAGFTFLLFIATALLAWVACRQIRDGRITNELI